MEEEIELGVNKVDYLVSALKSISGLTPFAGNFFSEIIGLAIPNQRLDRIEQYLRILLAKIEKYSIDFKAEINNNKNLLLLFEKSVIYSAQTTSEKKYDWYSDFIIKSIKEKDVEDIQQERLLKILSELNENEIIILIFYSLNPTIGMQNKFIEENHNILFRESNEMGLPTINYVKNEFNDLYKRNLEQCGLLKIKPKINRELNTVIINKANGEIEQEIPNITMLGRLLVDFIGGDKYKEI